MSLYSIGYGSRSIKDFSLLLERYGIRYLIDVRSKPYSKFSKDFSRNAIAQALEAASIRYVFMGDTLGGIPDDDECYTNGKVDYKKTAKSERFSSGINRLIKASQIPENVVIMCSEGKPEECHRCKLIGEELASIGVEITHIDERGVSITQEEAMERLRSGQGCLFDENLTSVRKYR